MKIDINLLSVFIKSALAEDVGNGDHTSLACIPNEAKGSARLLFKEDGILAGVEIAKSIFKEVDSNLLLELFFVDGDFIKKGTIILQVFGKIQSILLAERLVLNCMQRMSGIATETARLSKLIKHTKCKILDTRKTVPGMRMMDKMAVKIGGGTNHRIGLFDAILIKDNHVDYAGGISNAIQRSTEYLKIHSLTIPIIIETRNLEEVKEVLTIGGIDRIMLDNFSIEKIKEALKLIDNQYITEVSGGINEKNLIDYAETGVDFISMGYLTHTVRNLDISLKANKELAN